MSIPRSTYTRRFYEDGEPREYEEAIENREASLAFQERKLKEEIKDESSYGQ